VNAARLGLLLLTAYLLLASAGLDAPLQWDDLHLIRPYSGAELASTWRGPWDPDGVETPGFRPLTTLFNHARASAFGDNVVAHRLLLVALFALDSLLVWSLASTVVGAEPRIGFLAGVLAFASLASTATYQWIADGVHLVVLAFVLGAVATFARYSTGLGGRGWLALSAVLQLLALLTRPEAFAAYPLLLLVLLADPDWRAGRRRVRPALIAYGAFVAFALVVVLAWQRAVVPDTEPIWLFVELLPWVVIEGIAGVANPDHTVNGLALWREWALLTTGGLVATALLALVLQPRGALLWLTAGLAAALPVLAGPRSNLLVLPTLFWMLAVATVLVAALRRRGWIGLVGTIALLALLLPSALASRQLQLEHRWSNLEWACANATALYRDQVDAPIPPGRRAALAAQLSGLRIRSAEDATARLPALVDAARAPGGSEAFVPALSLLVDPEGKVTPCGDDLTRLARG
jgi:hypothetical protein